MLAWRDRQDFDPESGASHLAHVMACCAILIDAEAHGALIDDRPIGGAAGELIARFTSEPKPALDERHRVIDDLKSMLFPH